MNKTILSTISSAALLLSGAALAQGGPPAGAGGAGENSNVEFHTASFDCGLMDAFFGKLDPVTFEYDADIVLEVSLARNPVFGPSCTEITGYANLAVRSDTAFTVRVTAGGFTPGHAVTLWAADARFVGGFMASGIVSGSGEVNLAGNNCIYAGDLATDPNAGFEPGGNRQCDLLDLGVGPAVLPPGLNVWLVDHGLWSPGDMAALWTTQGLPGNTAALFDLSEGSD